jgi:hypothetical protein
VKNEASLVREFGKQHALWHSVSDVSSVSSPHTFLFRAAMWQGHDMTGPFMQKFSPFLKGMGLADEDVQSGVIQISSVVWSTFILTIEPFVLGPQSLILSLGLWWFWARRFLKTLGWLLSGVLQLWLLFVIVVWHLNIDQVVGILQFIVTTLMRVFLTFTGGHFPIFWEWLQLRIIMFLTSVLVQTNALNSEVKRYHSESLHTGSKKLVAHFRQMTMQAVLFINDINLPSFVRRRFRLNPSVELLQQSKDLMAAIGWPINVELAEPEEVDTAGGSFTEWLLCGTDFKQGIHNCRTYIDHDLQYLRATEVFRRTEEYASVENELISTSRYFKNVDYDFPQMDVDDIWLVVKDIFAHSKLTPFNYIIAKWEKKYALGSFMRDPDRPWRKYSRKKFISDLGGYAPFKALWARTFYYASQILPVSAVSVKGEALPERKWLNDKVRSIIGSPITQYILSTIWNYGPNHKFAWESTPIKIGMPLNGYWMSSIWHRHARCQIHVQGDLEAFDSTVSGKVTDLIAAIRKKGFTLHKDRDAIGELIDINYEQVSSQLLNTTSTGNVYLKGTGLTTGHSSTSMDNSLALVILYLMAWKDLTGLSASEFLHYNELSCYGDDHILSSLATKPAVWSPKNIRASMKRWGLTNNLDIKSSLDDVSFLSKFGRKANAGDRAELAKHGITNVFFLVWHDKGRLVGKLTAKLLNVSASYRIKRLLSYLDLTAHHPDVYDGIVKTIRGSKSLMAMVNNNKLRIPSYSSILHNWYSASPGQPASTEFDDEVDEMVNSGKLVEYGAVNALDSIFGAFSMIPDFLSPLLYNFGYARAFQVYLRARLSWVVDFVVLSNNISSMAVLQSTLSRTPYRFIDVSLHVPGNATCNKTEMLIRHWLFLLYIQFRPLLKYGAWLNFIINRVASAQFVLNGRLFFEQRQSEIQIDIILICALLDFVVWPDWLSQVMWVTLPDLQLIVDLVEHFVLVSIWSVVPPNFREVTNSLRNLNPSSGPLGISAPTGTGKSTALIQHMSNVVGHKYRKIIVIEPRTMLVTGLVSYMSSNFGASVSGSTTGLDLDTTSKIWYMTPQALLGHVEYLNSANLFVIDEAHIDERYYKLMRRVFLKLKLPLVLVSATLTEPLMSICDKVIPIPIAQIWSVTELVEKMDATEFGVKKVLNVLRDKALSDANNLPPGTKGLFYLPRITDVEWAVEKCKRNSYGLHSKAIVPLDWGHDVYFTTNISDVGITIPGVSYVWTSTVADIIDNDLIKTTVEVQAQRKGRTGRTNNGIFKVLDLKTSFNSSRSRTEMSASGLRQMISEGLPIELAWAYDKNSTLTGLGFDLDAMRNVDEDQVLRSLVVFYRNFKPVFQGIAAASQANVGSFGNPVTLFETGVGNISSSFPQPDTGIEDHILALSNEVISSALAGRAPPMESDSFRNLASIAGPVFAVKNFVMSLSSDLEDGSTDLLNPKNKNPSGSWNDVYEVSKILSLIKELDN